MAEYFDNLLWSDKTLASGFHTPDPCGGIPTVSASNTKRDKTTKGSFANKDFSFDYEITRKKVLRSHKTFNGCNTLSSDGLIDFTLMQFQYELDILNNGLVNLTSNRGVDDYTLGFAQTCDFYKVSKVYKSKTGKALKKSLRICKPTLDQAKGFHTKFWYSAPSVSEGFSYNKIVLSDAPTVRSKSKITSNGIDYLLNEIFIYASFNTFLILLDEQTNNKTFLYQAKLSKLSMQRVVAGGLGPCSPSSWKTAKLEGPKRCESLHQQSKPLFTFIEKGNPTTNELLALSKKEVTKRYPSYLCP